MIQLDIATYITFISCARSGVFTFSRLKLQRSYQNLFLPLCVSIRVYLAFRSPRLCRIIRMQRVECEFACVYCIAEV